jgi:dTDP-4-dehydrorhamnose 3,5-epimerase
MKFIRQKISDVVLIEPLIHSDERGYFLESYNKPALEQFLGQEINFVKDSESKSSKMVLRGLHYQLAPFSQAKLVRVIAGTVLDIAVDIRVGSKSYGQHIKVVLSAENKNQLFIPRGFAHGFLVLSDEATFVYKVDNEYEPTAERTLAWNDESLGIEWGLGEDLPLISDKDSKGFSLQQIIDESNRVE